MQDARQQVLGHVMSTETKALLFASFIGGFIDGDKMAVIASDPVMTFQRCTQLSNGQNKQPKRSGNTGLLRQVYKWRCCLCANHSSFNAMRSSDTTCLKSL
jgi:hypothetical protein